MKPVLAVVAPGQGAQTPGMLAAWREVPAAAEVLAAMSEAADLDLLTLGTTGSADQIRPTEVAQPLVVATSLATVAAIPGGMGGASVVAGHSVGEWAAAVLAGSLDQATAAQLVTVRGQAMAAAAAAGEPSGMVAVLGGDEATVLEAITARGLWAANINGAGQIVAAGPLSKLAAFTADPPAGARVRPLDVAAAFHTPLMQPAVATLAAAAATTAAADPQLAFAGNADGALATSGAGLLADLVAQVARPVRFDLVLTTFARLGVTAVLELAPGAVLTALVKRQLPGVATLAVKSPDNLDAAAAFIGEHSAADAGAAVAVGA